MKERQTTSSHGSLQVITDGDGGKAGIFLPAEAHGRKS